MRAHWKMDGCSQKQLNNNNQLTNTFELVIFCNTLRALWYCPMSGVDASQCYEHCLCAYASYLIWKLQNALSLMISSFYVNLRPPKKESFHPNHQHYNNSNDAKQSRIVVDYGKNRSIHIFGWKVYCGWSVRMRTKLNRFAGWQTKTTREHKMNKNVENKKENHPFEANKSTKIDNILCA